MYVIVLDALKAHFCCSQSQMANHTNTAKTHGISTSKAVLRELERLQKTGHYSTPRG